MIFHETALPGAYLIDYEPLEDQRGFFARSFCQEEFKQRGLNPNIAQCNISYSRKRGTLRGMHYQAAPFEEAKLIRCTRGAIYDVIMDLRRDSSTFMHWSAVELTHANRRMLYVPEGFAHGFQTLDDDTEVFYQMSAAFAPEFARGIRWNDPAFQIHWPPAARIISWRDEHFPDFNS